MDFVFCLIAIVCFSEEEPLNSEPGHVERNHSFKDLDFLSVSLAGVSGVGVGPAGVAVSGRIAIVGAWGVSISDSSSLDFFRT